MTEREKWETMKLTKWMERFNGGIFGKPSEEDFAALKMENGKKNTREKNEETEKGVSSG